jgi:hypothetical protein
MDRNALSFEERSKAGSEPRDRHLQAVGLGVKSANEDGAFCHQIEDSRLNGSVGRIGEECVLHASHNDRRDPGGMSDESRRLRDHLQLVGPAVTAGARPPSGTGTPRRRASWYEANTK